MQTSFSFTIRATDSESQARAGVIQTPHGTIHTPAFVPVGTQAAVKSLTPDDVSSLDVNLCFVNTYHMAVRPGVDVIKKLGGLHSFMGWNRSIITDSGGFQVFSLGSKKYINAVHSEAATREPAKFVESRGKNDPNVFPDDYKPVSELVKIHENGVTFTSHWDGRTVEFTPEESIRIQNGLASDIMIAFDECAPYPTTHEYATQAMDRTHRWLERSRIAWENGKKQKEQQGQAYQALYGVVQGSVYEDLRKHSAQVIANTAVDGVAIGGVSVGEGKDEMKDVYRWVIPHLPKEKPRHVLGVGEIDDIPDIIASGIDTFDCVQPTRLARMGQLFTLEKGSTWVFDITKKQHAEDSQPIDTTCACYTCRHFSRAYVHHLFRVRELTAYRLATLHNIYTVNRLVAELRDALISGTFGTAYEQCKIRYGVR